MRMRERAGALEIIGEIIWIFSIYNQSERDETSRVLWWYIVEHANNSVPPPIFLFWRPTSAVVSVNKNKQLLEIGSRFATSLYQDEGQFLISCELQHA